MPEQGAGQKMLEGCESGKWSTCRVSAPLLTPNCVGAGCCFSQASVRHSAHALYCISSQHSGSSPGTENETGEGGWLRHALKGSPHCNLPCPFPYLFRYDPLLAPIISWWEESSVLKWICQLLAFIGFEQEKCCIIHYCPKQVLTIWFLEINIHVIIWNASTESLSWYIFERKPKRWLIDLQLPPPLHYWSCTV